jgi:hypothetical protein
MKLLNTKSYGKLTQTIIAERLKLTIYHFLCGKDPAKSDTKFELKKPIVTLKNLDSHKLSTFLLFGSSLDPQANKEKISIGDVFDLQEIKILTQEINKYIDKRKGSADLNNFINNFVDNAEMSSTIISHSSMFGRVPLPEKIEGQTALTLTGLAFLLALSNHPYQSLGCLIGAAIIWKHEDVWELALDTIEQKFFPKHKH